MAQKRSMLIFSLAVAALILATSVFTVYEYERAILLRLGKIVTADNQVKVLHPGLHFKIPFIDDARYFDTRLQTAELQSTRILTAEKKDVIVDSFVKWRIKDLQLYFTRTDGLSINAVELLKQRVNDRLRAEFGQRTVKEVVSGERQQIMEEMRQAANQGAANFGIEVIDVRIKRIDLPPEVSDSVFNRMRAERYRIAGEHRAEGREKAEIITSNADANVTIILAESSSDAQKTRGEGDAIAAKIYADAYNSDPEFYAFYRSLDAYRTTFKNNNDVLVLNPESGFFRYFNDAAGKNLTAGNKTQ